MEVAGILRIGCNPKATCCQGIRVRSGSLREDPLLKLAVGRCPESGGNLCSQSTMGPLENMPSRREAVRMTGALVENPSTEITLDIAPGHSAMGFESRHGEVGKAGPTN